MSSQQEFEAWMLSVEHPVIGWISKDWFGPGDDPTTYANDYVQGAWVAYRFRPAPAEQPIAERLKAAGMITIAEFLKGTPMDKFHHYPSVVDLGTFSQMIELRRKECVTMQTRLELDKHEEDETFGWVLGQSAAYSEVVINFRAATAKIL